MSDRYKDSYRIQPVRLQKWDYGRNGLYFITLCTRKFDYYFGEIESGKMILLEIGNIAFQTWFAIPHIFSFIKLDEFVVMPNHVHGIIIIDKPVNPDLPACRGAIYRDSGVNNCVSAINNRDSDINNCNSAINNRDSDINNRDSCDENALIDKGVAINRASTDGETLKSPGGITGKKNPMLHDNLSRIIRWYKGRVAFESHQVDACFDWQPRFYDHIIRNEQEYLNISHYISNNPRNWREDKFFKK